MKELHVTEIFLSDNNLTGAFPSLAGLTALNYAYFGNNHLTGTIPSFASLTNLRGFSAIGNQLTGPIPLLAALTNLAYFLVDNNQLIGNIPDAPNPNNLFLGYSILCPNSLNPAPNAEWDIATGITP